MPARPVLQIGQRPYIATGHDAPKGLAFTRAKRRKTSREPVKTMFITPAYAAGAGNPGGDLISMFLPLVLIMGVFWFLLIRPQQKKMKEHQAMLANLRRGDNVVTSGGLIGKVAKVAGDEVTVELAEGVKVKVKKNYIAEVRVKGQPAPANDGK